MMKNINDKYIKCIDKKMLLEFIYLLILALYLIRLFFDTTMFSLPWPTKYFDFLRLSIGAYLVTKVVLKGYKSVGECLFYFLYLIVFSLVYRKTGYLFLLEMAFFVLGAKDISYKKILGLYLFIVSIIMTITIMAALTGCIKDLIYFDDGMYKHAFGIVFSTDFGAHVFFLILVYMAYKDKTPGVFLNILVTFVAFILYFFSGARNSSGSLLLLLLAGQYIGRTDKVLINDSIDNYKFKKIRLTMIKYIDYCLILSVPICAFLSILVTILYSKDNKVLSVINSIVSGRLGLGKAAIDKYGLSLWGTPFDMIGAGGDTVGRIGYNFIDSSYVMIFIRYGSVLFILTVITFVLIGLKANNAGKRYLLVILWAMAVQCTIEHHMLEIAYNPFVLFVFSKIDNSESCHILSINKERKRTRTLIISIVVALLFLIFIHNKLFAYVRTMVELLRLSDATRNIFFVCGVFIILLVIIAIIIANGNLLYYVIDRGYKKKTCKWAIISGIGVALLCIGFKMGEELIKQKSINYLETVKSGTNILKKLNPESEFTLYIDHIPYLYMTGEEKIDNIIQGSPYRNSKDEAVVITDSSKEMTHLIRSGYVCGKISDAEYIYTNDQTITDSLRKHGIEMNDYYAEKKVINLISLAGANNLSTDHNGRVLIDGNNKSLIHGPWVTIYQGRLKVDFDMTLLDTDILEGKIATLRLSYGSGAKILKEVAVNKLDFDDSGHLLTSIVCDIPDSEGIEFLVFVEGKTKIQLNSLTYGKVKKE
uniref:hypothetical protein n=1 Tax=Clostridium sp. 12(A) TaxID=1163671 RepID=UPI00046408A7|nr:hypothetical protein [Clostridium sp. 12(A)]